MMRSYALALSSAALFLALGTPSDAQSVRTGRQCVPAVADASMYRNCRLRIVQGQETCRCAIRPQALHRTDRIGDQDNAVTGSIGSRPVTFQGSESPVVGAAGAVSSGTATGNTGTVSGSVGSSRGGAVAESGTTTTGSTGGSRSAGSAGSVGE